MSIRNLYAMAAVPEPESYAMLIAGLGLVSSMTRTAKKRGAQRKRTQR
ncbi:PEP-CTERM sorting domain-containing protein [Xylophilus sp. GOD-11R]